MTSNVSLIPSVKYSKIYYDYDETSDNSPKPSPKPSHRKKISLSDGSVHSIDQDSSYIAVQKQDNTRWEDIPNAILELPEEEFALEKRSSNYKNKTVSITTNLKTNEINTKKNSILNVNKPLDRSEKTRKLKRSIPTNSHIQKSISHWNEVKDAQANLDIWIEKLDSLVDGKRLSLQLKIGRDIDTILDSLEELMKNQDATSIEGLKDEILQTIEETEAQVCYKKYRKSQHNLLERFEGNKISNKFIIEKILNCSIRMDNPLENQNKLNSEKETYFETLILRVIQGCEEVRGLIVEEHKELLSILRECKDRAYVLLEEAKKFKTQEELVDYLDRLINAMVVLKNKSYSSITPTRIFLEYSLKRPNESLYSPSNNSIPRDTSKSWDKIDEVSQNVPSIDIKMLISDIQTLLGLIENDFIFIHESKCKDYEDKYEELL
ncbi:MAG TPA: hypothetical protein VGP47_06310, partial [Parachlamydiaceae bacterium]|nr:hypothetical protein [Parachlamydiaceae bacterium]